ncbi:hypothetical protein Aperf_G00000071084 [Anoplocephala perfoliata]
MNGDADFEEGEINDLSDFEEGNMGDVGAVSPLGSCSRNDSPSYRVHCRSDKHGKYNGVDSRYLELGRSHSNGGRGSLLRYFSDDESPPRRRTPSRAPRAKPVRHNPAPQRKRKRRDQNASSTERLPPKKHERPNCRFHVEGRCIKGSECPFNHDFSPVKKQELCKFYAAGTCSKGSACPYMHSEFPCKFFHLTNDCYHGKTCKFSHEPLTASTRSLLDRFIDEQNRDSHANDDFSVQREPPPEHPSPVNKLTQDPFTEPHGDVDYRQMLPSGSPVMGPQGGGPGASQIPLQGPSRRPPLEPHIRHFRRPFDECRPPLPPPRGYCPPPLYRGPFPPPYRFRPAPPYPMPQRAPLSSGNRELRSPIPRHPYQPRFRAPYFNNGAEEFDEPNLPTQDAYYQEQFNRDTVDQEDRPPEISLRGSSITDQPEFPEMTISKDNIIITSDKSGSSDDTFCWQIVPIEFDKNSRQLPPSAANAAPNDPRLKARPQLPVLLNIPIVSTEQKVADTSVSQPERRKRPKLELNERANPLVTAGMPKPTETAISYSRILDPRLLKRKKVETEIVPPAETPVDDDDPSLTPKPLRVVLSP